MDELPRRVGNAVDLTSLALLVVLLGLAEVDRLKLAASEHGDLVLDEYAEEVDVGVLVGNTVETGTIEGCENLVPSSSPSEELRPSLNQVHQERESAVLHEVDETATESLATNDFGVEVVSAADTPEQVRADPVVRPQGGRCCVFTRGTASLPVGESSSW